MLANYRLIQFVPDRMFPAPVTVGVVAWTPSGKTVRLLGFNARLERMRAGPYRRAFGLGGHGEGVILEWIDWFRTLVSRRGQFDELGVSTLDRLAESSSPFIAAEAGEAEIAEAVEIEGLADDLYRRSVLSGDAARIALLEDEAELCLAGAGLPLGEGEITEDAEVEFAPKGKLGRGLVHFDWLYDIEPRAAGFKVIDFGRNENAVGRQVADIMSTFEVAHARKLLERERCFVFHDRAITDHVLYGDWLRGVATLINLEEPDSPARLRDALRD